MSKSPAMHDIKSCGPAMLEHFARVFGDMDAQIVTLKKENAELESKLRVANFPTLQAAKCGRCGEYKHTPWRTDDYGYICASCLVAIKDEEIAAAKAEKGGW